MSDNEDYFSDNNSDSEIDNDSVTSSDTEDDIELENNDKNKNIDGEDDDDDNDLIDDIENEDDIVDDDDDDDEEDEYDYELDSQTGGAPEEELEKVVAKKKQPLIIENEDEDDDDENDDVGENYLQKFNNEINRSYVEEYHPECIIHNHDEISALTKIIRDGDYNIIDPLHRTLPFLTKYEKTRIIGQRAKQINSGAKPFIKVPENVIDGYLIAELELQQKRIPFIIRRPLNNGGSEYWNLKDLEIINF